MHTHKKHKERRNYKYLRFIALGRAWIELMLPLRLSKGGGMVENEYLAVPLDPRQFDRFSFLFYFLIKSVFMGLFVCVWFMCGLKEVMRFQLKDHFCFADLANPRYGGKN